MNLRGCTPASDLLLRLAGMLALPPHLVQDWVGAAARARSAAPCRRAGQVLLLEHSEDLRAHARDEFKRAMEALQAASGEWAARGRPLWSFIVLDEAEFDALG